MTGEPNVFLEPWGLTPADVADLTDDQIDRLYRRPAIRRAEAMKREAGDGAEGSPAVSLDDARPDRETFVATMMDQFGLDRAKWDADYDRLVKSWEK